MSRPNQPAGTTRTAPLFRPPATPAQTKASAPADPIPSSSPAFGTPVHTLRPHGAAARQPTKSSALPVLPILLPPPTLRPLAFRTFTKKHNLTITSSALQSLATFIGRHCGAAWREEGLAEKILEEVAKIWKKNGGGVIVDGDGEELKGILRNLEGSMSGGRIIQSRSLSRQSSFAFGGDAGAAARSESPDVRPGIPVREDSQSSLGFSAMGIEDDAGEDENKDPRHWLKIIGAFEQPRHTYNVGKRHFERITTPATLFPPASHKTQLFRNRYNLIHQRLLRNESFQTPSFAPTRAALHRSASDLSALQSYKLTPIANLLGRSGTGHLLLGLLTIAPTGTLAISDLTGSISLDLTDAKRVPEDGAWFAPGMIVLVDGIYEEDYNSAGGGLGGGGGVGGTIGGKFIGFSVGGPPCERREFTLGINIANMERDMSSGGAFGWVDFLGVGSERAMGSRMRAIEQRVLGTSATQEDSNTGRSRIVIMAEINLDNPRILVALKKVLGTYASELAEDSPMTFVLMGNFVQHAVMAGGGSGGSVEYKEYFDSLASTLADYPSVLQRATFVFVPGDNDPWASAFSAGAATAIPRQGVPELFTSRVKRAFATANTEAENSIGQKTDGSAVWTTNPARLSLFGPTQELVLFRDDISGRLRRNAIRFRASEAGGEEVEEEEAAEGGDVQMSSTPAATTTTTAAAPLSEEQPPNEASSHSEPMEIDSAVQAAESHTAAAAPPKPNGPNRPPGQVQVSPDLHTARKLVKTVLDQGHLSPFPLATRPVLWDYAGSLQLYPLPTAVVLADQEAPSFAVTYEGCHVMNPGKLVPDGKRAVARWIEYDARTRRGRVREALF
ncbi:MAG: hypothetical protein M1819_000991 [Sarea resinae]|nr:MAG: hypothetical protein M1819_000991 [Sarea resinae]